MLLGCDRPRLTQGLPGPLGPEARKSPKRVRKEYPGAGPQKCPKSAPRSLKRVRKESESQVLDSFRTLLRLRGALFGHFWGSGSGYPFRTLFGLFRASGPEGPGRPCVGRGRSPLLGLCRYKFLEQKWFAYKSWPIGIENLASKSSDENKGRAPSKTTEKIVFQNWRGFWDLGWRGFFGTGRRAEKSTRNPCPLPNKNPHRYFGESTRIRAAKSKNPRRAPTG